MKKVLIIATVVIFFIACNCGPILQKTTINYDATHRDSAWLQLPLHL